MWITKRLKAFFVLAYKLGIDDVFFDNGTFIAINPEKTIALYNKEGGVLISPKPFYINLPSYAGEKRVGLSFWRNLERIEFEKDTVKFIGKNIVVEGGITQIEGEDEVINAVRKTFESKVDRNCYISLSKEVFGELRAATPLRELGDYVIVDYHNGLILVGSLDIPTAEFQIRAHHCDVRAPAFLNPEYIDKLFGSLSTREVREVEIMPMATSEKDKVVPAVFEVVFEGELEPLRVLIAPKFDYYEGESYVQFYMSHGRPPRNIVELSVWEGELPPSALEKEEQYVAFYVARGRLPENEAELKKWVESGGLKPEMYQIRELPEGALKEAIERASKRLPKKPVEEEKAKPAGKPVVSAPSSNFYQAVEEKERELEALKREVEALKTIPNDEREQMERAIGYLKEDFEKALQANDVNFFRHRVETFFKNLVEEVQKYKEYDKLLERVKEGIRQNPERWLKYVLPNGNLSAKGKVVLANEFGVGYKFIGNPVVQQELKELFEELRGRVSEEKPREEKPSGGPQEVPPFRGTGNRALDTYILAKYLDSIGIHPLTFLNLHEKYRLIPHQVWWRLLKYFDLDNILRYFMSPLGYGIPLKDFDKVYDEVVNRNREFFDWLEDLVYKVVTERNRQSLVTPFIRYYEAKKKGKAEEERREEKPPERPVEKPPEKPKEVKVEKVKEEEKAVTVSAKPEVKPEAGAGAVQTMRDLQRIKKAILDYLSRVQGADAVSMFKGLVSEGVVSKTSDGPVIFQNALASLMREGKVKRTGDIYYLANGEVPSILRYLEAVALAEFKREGKLIKPEELTIYLPSSYLVEPAVEVARGEKSLPDAMVEVMSLVDKIIEEGKKPAVTPTTERKNVVTAEEVLEKRKRETEVPTGSGGLPEWAEKALNDPEELAYMLLWGVHHWFDLIKAEHPAAGRWLPAVMDVLDKRLKKLGREWARKFEREGRWSYGFAAKLIDVAGGYLIEGGLEEAVKKWDLLQYWIKQGANVGSPVDEVVYELISRYPYVCYNEDSAILAKERIRGYRAMPMSRALVLLAVAFILENGFNVSRRYLPDGFPYIVDMLEYEIKRALMAG